MKLELRRVTKRFGDLPAVKELSLVLREGEFLSLLGPSGCGKSTTLALIAGFLEPDAGEIRIDGEAMNAVPPRRRRIGLVFQDYAVFTKLTVRRNLAFGLEAQGVRPAERSRRILEYARQFDLESVLDRRGHALNMSEMQRVALARVLATEPKLLLLDEPMSNLDAAQRYGLRSELKQLQKSLRQTVLYVTHDQVEAMSMSDRIAVMRAGEILQVGSPEDIYHRPVDRFVAEFIGDPPINILPCRVVRNGPRVLAETACHAELLLGCGTVEPGAYELAIRPHGFKASRAAAAGAAPAVVRFVENFGAEHVLHLEYGPDLVRTVVAPGFADVGDRVFLAVEASQAHLLDRADGRVVRLDRIGIAA